MKIKKIKMGALAISTIGMRESVNFILTADRMPLVWYMRYKNGVGDRVYGPDLMRKILDIGSDLIMRYLFVMEILLRAKVLIYISREENFGIVLVKALKLGIAVIAYNSRGVKEIVFVKKNGVLFERFNNKSLMKAIIDFEKMKFSKNTCQKSVKKYSSYFFIKG